MALEDIDQFFKDRETALLSMDEQTVRAYAIRYMAKMAHALQGDAFWGAVHTARTALESLPAFEREASRRWLAKHNLSTWNIDIVVPSDEAKQLENRCAEFGV